jgi:hypothetical protein
VLVLRALLARALAAATVPAALGICSAAPAPAWGDRAWVARSLGVRDEGRLRYRSAASTSILDEGRLSGTIPGKGRVDFIYNGSPNVTARFTIYADGGSIYGQARCRLHNPTSATPSFKGALQITGGSGRYADAHGSGQLYGVFYRRGYGLSVQAIGGLSY